MRAAEFPSEVAIDGMWHAALVRSPAPHGHVRSVDASALSHDCVALLPGDTRALGRFGPQLADRALLANPARFAGDVVAAVAAPTRAAARAAARALVVGYEELPAVFDPLAAVAEGAPLLHPDAPAGAAGVHPLARTNVCHHYRLLDGEVERGFAAAHVVVEETFRTAVLQPAALEPGAALAAWTPDDRLELWAATPAPAELSGELARLLGIEPERVSLVAKPNGGLPVAAETPAGLAALAACLARKAARPVKLRLDRSEEFVTLNSQPAVIRIRAGAAEDGTLVAKQVECWADTGAYAERGPEATARMGRAAIGPYRTPHVRVDALAVYTNLPPGGAWPAAEAGGAVWASERTMDRLAARLGMSPLELRRRNLLRDGDRCATGEVMQDVHLEQCLLAAAEAVGYEQEQRGKGLCLALACGRAPWAHGAAAAQVSVDEDTGRPTVERLHAAVHGGSVADPTRAGLQGQGAMVMGLGIALLEAVEHVDGQIANAGLVDYRIPAPGDLPRALTHELIGREPAPRGAGTPATEEIALAAVPGAIGNALGSLGLPLGELPMTAERVLDALSERDGASAEAAA